VYQFCCGATAGRFLLHGHQRVQFTRPGSTLTDISFVGTSAGDAVPRVEILGAGIRACNLMLENCALYASGAGVHLTKCSVDGANCTPHCIHIDEPAGESTGGRQPIVVEQCQTRNAAEAALYATSTAAVLVKGGR
jgi:hypothetical protein